MIRHTLRLFDIAAIALALAGCGSSRRAPTLTAPGPSATRAPMTNTGPPTNIVATAPTRGATSAGALPAQIQAIEDWHKLALEIDRAEPAAAQARAEEVWQAVVSTRPVPLVLGAQVLFLYKGKVQRAEWHGVFNTLAVVSPAMWALHDPEGTDSKEKAEGALKMAGPLDGITNCRREVGVERRPLPLTVVLSFGVPEGDVGNLAPIADENCRGGITACK